MKLLVGLLMISALISLSCLAEYDAIECTPGTRPERIASGWICVDDDEGLGNVLYPKGRSIERFYE